MNIDKSLIKAYKYMLVHKLQNTSHWSASSSKERSWSSEMIYEYEHTFSNNGVSVRFTVKYDDTVEMKISGTLVHTFTMMGNWDLFSKVLKFKKMKKNESALNEKHRYEEMMKQALPDDYKRAIKISKIKNKI